MEKFFLSFNIFSRFFLLTCTLALASCQAPEGEKIYGIDSNTIVSGSFNQYDNAKVSGTGSIRFETIAATVRHSLTVRTSLYDALTLSAMSLHFYSDSPALSSTKGVVVHFERQGASVMGSIQIGNSSYSINNQNLIYYIPTSLNLIVEVHNSSPARVLIWRKDVGIYTADTADVDTARAGDLTNGPMVGSGAGTYVGISLNLATLSAAQATTPQVSY